LNNKIDSRIITYFSTPASLAEFVQGTAAPATWVYFHFKDVNNVFGIGANAWIKGFVQYQNPYDSQWGVGGQGICYGTNPYYFIISGTASGGFSINLTPMIPQTVGSAVNIASYNTSNNKYTCPTDGYIIVTSDNPVGSYAQIIVNDVVFASAVNTEQNYNFVVNAFVKKGMQVYVKGKYAGYYPLY